MSEAILARLGMLCDGRVNYAFTDDLRRLLVEFAAARDGRDSAVSALIIATQALERIGGIRPKRCTRQDCSRQSCIAGNALADIRELDEGARIDAKPTEEP